MNNKGYTLFELVTALFLLFIVVGGGTGWIMNIYKLTNCDFEAPYKAEVIRVIGIVPTIGAIVGYMDLGN